MTPKVAAIVLAAGKGTRFAGGKPSRKHKVLYDVAGQPLIAHTLKILDKLAPAEIVLVVGHKAQDVIETVGKGYKFAFQRKRLGTGHAAKIGLTEISAHVSNIMILNGDDCAFYKSETLEKVLTKHLTEKNTITFITLEPKDPSGLGRVIREKSEIVKIIEEKAATEAEKKIREINDGVYIFQRSWLEKNLPKIQKSKAGEYYLVDLIEMAVKSREKVKAFKLADPSEWYGVNTPEDLAKADLLMKRRVK